MKDRKRARRRLEHWERLADEGMADLLNYHAHFERVSRDNAWRKRLCQKRQTT